MLFYCLDIWISHPGSSRRTRGQVEGCPAGSPAQINGPAGAAPRQTSGAFAEEEGGAAERAKPAACGGMRDAELVPTRAPLCVVAGVGFIREGPHRKGPSLVRLFGHFLSAQKVTRGVGPGRPHEKGPGGGAPESHRIEWQLFGKRDVSPPPARRHANLSPSVPCAGTDPSKKIEARRQAGLQDHHAMSFSISSSREPNRSRASWTGLGLDMSTPAPLSRSTGSLEQPPERN